MSDNIPSCIPSYTIYCAILGDNAPFPINIKNNQSVGELQEQIKVKGGHILAPFEPRTLVLYKVEIDVSEKAVYKSVMTAISQRSINVDNNVKLEHLLDTLLDCFGLPSLPIKTIHILVDVPVASASVVPDLATERRCVLKSPIGREPPSAFGNSSLFVTHRPPRADVVPLDLVHSVFGEFLDDAQNGSPEEPDYQLVESLRSTMAGYWNKELEQCQLFRSILAEHYEEISLSAGTTNGHIDVNGFLITALEGKRVGGEAEVQGSMHFLEALRAKLDKSGLMENPFPFPCIIITLVGTHVGFSGAVLTKRFELGTLTPLFPLHDNPHVSTTRVMPLVRAFWAFRNAVAKLRREYQGLSSSPTKEPLDPYRADFPYPNYYKDKPGQQVFFKYDKRLLEDGLMFLATRHDGRCLFIKFTHQYGEDAHRACSDAGVAPPLHAVVEFPGGWFMVVMDYLDPTTFKHVSDPDTDLKAAVYKAVDVLHDRRLVHGDLRDCNVMYRKVNGAWIALLLDFDWSGKYGEVRYPGTINRITVDRPAGVQGAKPILMEHDRAMIELL